MLKTIASPAQGFLRSFNGALYGGGTHALPEGTGIRFFAERLSYLAVRRRARRTKADATRSALGNAMSISAPVCAHCVAAHTSSETYAENGLWPAAT